MIDLHTHTTASDGTMAPAELIEAAYRAGVTALAVTDHDTVEGLDSCLEAGERLGVRVVPGIEINAGSKFGSIHLLGYFIDHQQAALRDRLKHLQHFRADRNLKMIANLQSLGIDIQYDEVRAEAGDGSIGRPHFARVLIRKGLVHSIREAFDAYLRDGGPAYAERVQLPAAEAIGLIQNAGGIAVLAHPYRFRFDPARLRAAIEDLLREGLDGVETYYSEHSEELTKFLQALSEEVGFLTTGGSDFHGDNKPHIALGKGRGNLNIPESLLEPMEARLCERGETPPGTARF